MTATVTYKVEEEEIDQQQFKYRMRLIDDQGNAVRTMRGPSKERCIQALEQSGFKIQD